MNKKNEDSEKWLGPLVLWFCMGYPIFIWIAWKIFPLIFPHTDPDEPIGLLILLGIVFEAALVFVELSKPRVLVYSVCFVVVAAMAFFLRYGGLPHSAIIIKVGLAFFGATFFLMPLASFIYPRYSENKEQVEDNGKVKGKLD